MRFQILITFSILFLFGCSNENGTQNVITTDIDNFWTAYDRIQTTDDSTEQMQFLKTLFLDKGTEGLTAIMQVRNYTAEEYLAAINAYPKFWESVRPNMMKAKDLGTEINKGIEQLRAIYPDLKPAKLYFSVGVFRTGGTTLDSLVLIGSEVSLTNENTNTTEFPKNFQYLKNHFATNPMKEIVFLNVHEYVHTQQKSAIGSNLLTQCLREGVAEFIAEKATKKMSTSPAIKYGNDNREKVKQQFIKEMFNHNYSYWLWSSRENQFNTRDLGYFIGYDLATKYYDQTADKKAAIKTLIELDYSDDNAIVRFVDQLNYYSKSIKKTQTIYNSHRPKVINIEPFENGNKTVNPNIKKITVEFSTKMNTSVRGFEFGPLGENNVIQVKNIVGWSKGDTAFTFEVSLEPNKQYQLVLSNRFASSEGYELENYLIEIWTEK